ncbi:unnamed protein product [Colias eurytheme]|nr:unnamed protein product [Colias eurytheme]
MLGNTAIGKLSAFRDFVAQFMFECINLGSKLKMGSQQKDIELSPVRVEMDPNKQTPANQSGQANDEEDIIIGRFRKISSAKSMAATNGNIQYPTDLPKPDVDVESGLHFRAKEEGDKLLDKPNHGEIMRKSAVTKSSFRDIEKPSRFKDQPSATRFQVS